MTEELKLLNAMCKALGLNVERKVTQRYGLQMSALSYSRQYGMGRAQPVNRWDFVPSSGDVGSHYKEVIIDVDYVVTKG